MRKLFSLVFVLVATLSQVVSADDSNRLVAVCSTTQVADFTRQVVGDRWEVVSLLEAGQDPHLYQTTAGDARQVAEADLCVENGWHLEGGDWMRTLATDAGKPLVTAINGVEGLPFEENGQVVQDPHAWFSPLNASIYVRNILAGVIQIDAEHAAEYEARTALYLEQLRSLHLWATRQISTLPEHRRVMVTSHDAFSYFCNQYGLQAASPIGWATSPEVGGGITLERRRETVESIRQFGVPAIFVETSVNAELMHEIAREAGVVIGGKLYSDSMGEAGSAGETYIGMIRENVLTIVGALQ